MKRLMILAIVLSPYIASAADGDVTMPLEIKGFTVGLEKAQVRGRFEAAECYSSDYCMHSLRISAPPHELDSFAGGKADYFAAHFNSDKLSRLTVRMSTSSAPTVISALIEKYGPGMRQEEEFKTKGGLTTTKVKVTWRNGDSRLVVESPSGSINHMMVRLYSQEQMDRSALQMKEKAAKDL